MAIPLTSPLKRSRLALGLLLLSHAGACVALFVLLVQYQRSGWLITVSILLSCLIVCAGFRYQYLLWRAHYRHLQISTTGQLSLTDAADTRRCPDLLQAELLSSSLLHPYLLVLHLRDQAGNRRWFVLYPDMCGRAEWSHLQVCLRRQLL